MHHALRADENPALEIAIDLAQQNGLPLLVYLGLSEDYPYASDRLHTFFLQGLRDVAHELDRIGIHHYCHVSRRGHRHAALKTLTQSAAAVVTEEMPTEPLSGWIATLRRETRTPIAMVNCACLLPADSTAQWLDHETDVKTFRRRTRGAFESAIRRSRASELFPIRDVEMRHDEMQHDEMRQDRSAPNLAFWDDDLSDILETLPPAIDLKRQCLASLVGDCQIDHSVPPVRGTPGRVPCRIAAMGQIRCRRFEGVRFPNR